MTDYGTVEFSGRTIILDNQAELTGRLLGTLDYHDREDNDGEYNFEMSAPGHVDGTEVMVYWIFRNVEGWDLDNYDYDNVDRVEIE